MQELENRIFRIKNKGEFASLALEVFNLQAKNNEVYSEFLEHLKIDPGRVILPEEIPFLPIEFFKSHKIITGKNEAVNVFESSGTSGQISSKHFIVSEEIYRKSSLKTFTSFYGDPDDLCILALLPSYLERGNSSLVFMMNFFIQKSSHPESGFYLSDLNRLKKVLSKRVEDKHPTLLLGVSYALLDLAEQFPINLKENIRIMETGGMKGKRKEMVREELHSILKKSFSVSQIHSEYGMTELLSQAYSIKSGLFAPPSWMKVFIRDIYDPLTILKTGGRGGINIIDLANLYSCSFIATGDLGKVYENGEFEINGRLDNSEIRGCNLMVV